MADKVFTMRIDEKLLEKVRISAEANKRSLAKEIEYILEQSLMTTDEKMAPFYEIAELIKKQFPNGIPIKNHSSNLE